MWVNYSTLKVLTHLGFWVTGQIEATTIGKFSNFFPNATLEAHKAYINLPPPPPFVEPIVTVEFEVAIPIDRMADCLAGAMNLVYDGDPDGVDRNRGAVGEGFIKPVLFRFVGKDDGLLSLVNDVPRFFFDFDDVVSFNSGLERNEPLFKLMGFLVGSPLCSARLHWGKAGWPEEGCWNGVEHFPDTWCDFGCAVRALDPEGKFRDLANDRWNWEGGNLDGCCTENGYDRSRQGCTCNVIPVKNVEDCPPPPFYT